MNIFFDLDGTLTDSGVGVTGCLQHYVETGMFENELYPGVPEGLESLARDGRLRTSEFVLKEIERNDAQVYQRVRRLRHHMQIQISPALLREAGRLALTYPIMAHVNRDHETADPWVIAIAKENGYKVICEESAVKPQRMAWVCTREGVPCGNIHDLLGANGIRRRPTKI